MTAVTGAGVIVTFYSWKGGVGRTVALANIAVHLAQLGNNVLAVDWDLEAPGLDRYFSGREAQNLLETVAAPDNTGLIGLLCDAHAAADAKLDDQSWRRRVTTLHLPTARADFRHSSPATPVPLHYLSSGHEHKDYAQRISEFSWSDFFAAGRGGEWLEELRRQWIKSYNFVLIDSRTGLTDSGGVCTVQMPDLMFLVFTANEQSLAGGLRVVEAAQKGRRTFEYDRAPLVVVPLLSRWDGEKEVDLAETWMKRFDGDLAPLTGSWLPTSFAPRQFIEKTRVPHVARFSFGEPLPILTHSVSDPSLPGLSYVTISLLLHSRLADAGRIIDPDYKAPRQTLPADAQSEAALFALIDDLRELHREIARVERAYGGDSEELISLLSRAGLLLVRTARFSDAEPLLRRALATSERSLGSSHQDVAVALSNLAQLLQRAGRLAEAEPMYQRALAINEKIFGPDHQKVAANLNDLAGLLRDTDRRPAAEIMYRRALAIDEKSFGLDHPLVGADLNNLAGLLFDVDRFLEAEHLYRRALAIDELQLGPDHPQVALDLHNIAAVLWLTNRSVEAEPMYRRALAIKEKSFGPDHPIVAADLKNLANLLRSINRLAEVEPLYRRALAIDEKGFGANHATVADDLRLLADFLQMTGRLDEAEVLSRRASAIAEGGGQNDDRGANTAKTPHPPDTRSYRGVGRPCKFFILPDYKNMKNWVELADILVEVQELDSKGHVYLIPSSNTPPRVRDASSLRRDKAALDLKRKATEQFVQRYEFRLLDGEYFEQKGRSGKSTKVYCEVYDRFLVDFLTEQSQRK